MLACSSEFMLKFANIPTPPCLLPLDPRALMEGSARGLLATVASSLREPVTWLGGISRPPGRHRGFGAAAHHDSFVIFSLHMLVSCSTSYLCLPAYHCIRL